MALMTSNPEKIRKDRIPVISAWTRTFSVPKNSVKPTVRTAPLQTRARAPRDGARGQDEPRTAGLGKMVELLEASVSRAVPRSSPGVNVSSAA